ncbi:hypothetical protein [Burkholderia aenigmatica]|uniref:hypothetical protein n=1 Tax=Burkholderia aenigmatica TaxID=2015348 RepID=UPI001FD469F0|nr:hypothetical protein [Burkholderia aenigmatica]
MPSLQKINLGTPPSGVDGDTVRAALAKVNANTDVLSACVALGYSILGDNTTIAPNQVGTRFGLNIGVTGKKITLPLAGAVSINACVHLFNIGVAVAVGLQGNDGTQVTILNQGDWVEYVSDGTGYWHVAARGKMLPDEVVSGSLVVTKGLTVGGNAAVGGTLSVPGGIAGNLSVTGKIAGATNANILLNGTGELGNVGWLSNDLGAVRGGYAEGNYFTNSNAITSGNYVIDGSEFIPCAPGINLVLSAELYAQGMSKGQARVKVEAFDASKVGMSEMGSIAVDAGTIGWRYRSAVITTPANTAFLRVSKIADFSPRAVPGGCSIRCIKVEAGSVPSLYSQEASIVYLGGALPGKLDVVGRKDGVAPSAGNVGEIITTSNATISMPGNRTPVGTTILNLGPGEWDVQGSLIFNYNASGVVLTMAFVGVASTSGSLIAGQFAGIDGLSAQGWVTFVTPMVRFRFNSATTIWLNAQAAANANVPGFGQLTARRVAA